jgi:hypothetical protein
MIFEVIMAAKISMLFFWVVTPCRLAGRYQRFGGTYYFHLQRTAVLKMEALFSSEPLVST